MEAERRLLVEKLRELGGSAGNGRLPEALGWGHGLYSEIRAALLEDGAISADRGRGGSVALTNAREAVVAPPSEPAAWSDTREDSASGARRKQSSGCRVLRMALPAPDIVEAILDGRRPPSLQLDALMKPSRTEWLARKDHVLDRQSPSRSH